MMDTGNIAYPDPGPPAELVWIELDRLSVDAAYQRDASGNKSQRHIRRIAQNFSWAWFQPPTVVRRPADETGKIGFVVVDGQHRVEAARLHPAIDRIPCSVVTLPDQAAEVETFIAINGARMTVHAQHLLKARLAAGDTAASTIMEVCRRAGVQIAGRGRLGGLLPGRTQAAGKIEICIRRFRADAVVEALLALQAAAGERTNQLGAVAIGAACRLVHELEAGWDRDRFVRAVRGRPVEDWVHEARPFAFGMGGIDKAVAAAWKTAFDAQPVSIFPTATVVEKIDTPAPKTSPFSREAVKAAPTVAERDESTKQPESAAEARLRAQDEEMAFASDRGALYRYNAEKRPRPKAEPKAAAKPKPPARKARPAEAVPLGSSGFDNPRLAAIAAEKVSPPRVAEPAVERRLPSKVPPAYVPPPSPRPAPAPVAETPPDPPLAADAASHPNLAHATVAFGPRRVPAALVPGLARPPATLTAPAAPRRTLGPDERLWALALRPAIEARTSFAVFDDIDQRDVLLARRLAREAEGR